MHQSGSPFSLIHCGVHAACAAQGYKRIDFSCHFLQISLFLVKVLIIKPIYTCFSEHVVTLAHLISIIHLHPPRCCFFFFKSLFFSYKNTCSCTHTHRPLHILRTHTSKTHRKPSAYAMQQRGQEQGVNSRESGRGVGGVWEDHMHFTRD